MTSPALRLAPALCALPGLLLFASPRAAAGATAQEQESETIILDQDEGQERPAPPTPAPTPSATPPARAALPSPAAPERGERPRSLDAARLRIQALWFARQAYLEQNEIERAAEQVRAMQEYRQQEGLSHLDTLAGAFSYEGFRHLDAGKYGEAHAAFRLAKEFDPDLPHPYYGQARSLRGLRMGTIVAVQEVWEGARVAFRNFWSSYILLGNLALVSLLAVTLAGALFLVTLALKYQPLLRHDVSEWLVKRGFHDSSAALGGWAIFLLPLLAFLGWMWVLLLWTLSIFPYARRIEKTLASLVLLWGVGVAPAFQAVASVFRTSVDPEVRTLVGALAGGYDPERVAYLKETAAADPKNAIIQFLIGSQYRDGGYLNEALLHYKMAVQLDPRFHQAINNLGNLYFNTQNFSLAQQQFQQAVDLRPDFWIGYFNLHLAQYQQFHVEEAEKNLETARRLDPEGIGKLRTAELPKTALSARLSLDEAWPSVARSARGTRRSAPLWDSPYALAAGGTLAGSYAYAWRRRRRARACLKCGRPFCYRCRSGAQYPDYCTQCVHLFAKRDGLAPATKKAKLDEVQRYETRRLRISRAMSLLAPGVGHVWGDRAVLGILGLGAWSFCLLALFTQDRLLRFYQVAYADPRPLAGIVAVAGAALVWALVNAVSPLRRS